MTITIDKLIAIDKRMAEKLSEIQKQLDDVEEQRKVVRGTILEIMKEQNVESIRTPVGTVTRSVSDRYWPSDWTAMYAYILEHGAPELLERRVHQTNIKEWLEKHPNDHPPSLNVDRKYSITITKPRKKIGESTDAQ